MRWFLRGWKDSFILKYIFRVMVELKMPNSKIRFQLLYIYLVCQICLVSVEGQYNRYKLVFIMVY